MKNIGIDNESFMNFMEGLEIDFPTKLSDEEEQKETTFQYATRSFITSQDIKKIPYVTKYATNKISKFITEIIFVTSQELTENTKKKYGLRRSYKLL